jgi:tripartite-type tricarboxylate transporter receptor subunit TctC
LQFNDDNRRLIDQDHLMKIFCCFGPALLLGAIALAPQPAAAQTYPDHPVTLVVPYPAGGGNDVLARLVAEKMSKPLGGSIVVENRGGAGGTIATRQVAKSPPDGYTLLIATSSLAINPSLYPNVGYDPRKDFAPIGLIASSGNVVLVNPSVPARSIAELIELAKKTPGKLDFASTGSGSSVHLAAELFASMAGVKLNHVPYRGTAPALTDLLGGHVGLMFSTMPSALGLVRDGKVRALAVTGPKRSANFPDLPTVAEAGLPGYEAVLHYGLVAAAGTPRPIVDKLNAALREALADDTLRARFATEGAEPLPSTPEEYATDIDHEEIKWSKIVRESGAKGE